MSLLIVSTKLSLKQAMADSKLVRALAEARRQGFTSPEEFGWVGGAAWWFSTVNDSRGSGASLREQGRFAAYVGTLYWRGLTGKTLLGRLLPEYGDPAEMPLDEFAGSFAMVYSGRSGVWLFNDAIGIQRIYETTNRHLLSTSFLVCRSTIDAPKVNRLRAQEYVLFGANHGSDTPIAGIQVADPTLAIELDGARQITLYSAKRLRTPHHSFRTRGEAVEALSTAIVEDVNGIAHAFGTNIGMALSGGFDSRLLLAALDKVGVQPHLYVYGAPSDTDVRVASTIAARLGVDIEHIDKQAINSKQPIFTIDGLTSNIAFFDGLPTDGVFDAGADRLTRLMQVHDGRLNLNGGGGEILRNFFYLRDRCFTASELVSAFYSNWLPQTIRSKEERLQFLLTMQDGILKCLGYEYGSEIARNRLLPRSDVELVYSLYRLRYWMGRNNSIATRYGAFLTPLVHPKLISISAFLPLRWKSFGTIEAEVIRAISPRCASGPTAYGFEFSSGPDITYRLKILATMYRPVALRRRSAAIRRVLGLGHTATLPGEWRVFLAELPCQDWIAADALYDHSQLNRLLTLQAVLSDKLCGIGTDHVHAT